MNHTSSDSRSVIGSEPHGVRGSTRNMVNHKPTKDQLDNKKGSMSLSLRSARAVVSSAVSNLNLTYEELKHIKKVSKYNHRCVKGLEKIINTTFFK